MNDFFGRFELREHKVLVLGMLLCAYFTWHLFQGPRSILYLQDVRVENISLAAKLEKVESEKQDLESKVIKLRPETLDPDLLEERARVMLGYMREGEIMVVD